MRLIFRLLLISSIPASGLVAQQNMRPGTIELSASAGGLFDLPGATAFEGICQPGTTNCHQQLRLGKALLPMVDGEIAVSLSRFIWVYGDYSYVFPDRQSASASLGTVTWQNTVNRHYWAATGGMELSFPTIHGLVPLLRFGGGDIYQSYNNYEVGTNTTSPARNVTDAGGIKAGTIGGGVRWYLGERQGIRVMATGYYLGHSIEDIVASSRTVGGAGLSTRRSGGSITVGYFRQFGR